MLASATSMEAMEMRRRFDDDEEEFESGFDLEEDEDEDLEDLKTVRDAVDYIVAKLG